MKPGSGFVILDEVSGSLGAMPKRTARVQAHRRTFDRNHVFREFDLLADLNRLLEDSFLLVTAEPLGALLHRFFIDTLDGRHSRLSRFSVQFRVFALHMYGGTKRPEERLPR